jgi:hypothetical protein
MAQTGCVHKLTGRTWGVARRLLPRTSALGGLKAAGTKILSQAPQERSLNRARYRTPATVASLQKQSAQAKPTKKTTP